MIFCEIWPRAVLYKAYSDINYKTPTCYYKIKDLDYWIWLVKKVDEGLFYVVA